MFGNPEGELVYCACGRFFDILRGTKVACACGNVVKSKNYSDEKFKKALIGKEMDFTNHQHPTVYKDDFTFRIETNPQGHLNVCVKRKGDKEDSLYVTADFVIEQWIKLDNIFSDKSDQWFDELMNNADEIIEMFEEK